MREAELWISRVFALGREGEIEIGRDFFAVLAATDGAVKAGFLEDRKNELFRSAGIRGALEDDELMALEVRGDGARRIFNVGEIRFATFVKRRGNANEDGVHVANTRKFSGGRKMMCGNMFGNALRGNVLDIGLTTIELGDFIGIEIETEDRVAGVSEAQSQRQTNVAAADNADLQRFAGEKFRVPIRCQAHSPSVT